MHASRATLALLLAFCSTGCGPIAAAIVLATGSSSKSSTPLAGSTKPANAVPVATIDTPAKVQTGAVPISYTLSDAEGDPATVVVEFAAGSDTFAPASEKAGSPDEGLGPLATSSGGTKHVFVWDSLRDLGPRLEPQARIRIRPFESVAASTSSGLTTVEGSASTTPDFTVNNHVAPVATVQTPGSSSGDVTIAYTLADSASERTSILVRYSKDGGKTFLPATEATGGTSEGVIALTTTPAGVSHTFVWNSLPDLGAALVSGVLFQITPENDLTGAAVTTGAFTVNDNQPPAVSITQPGATQHGNVVIQYRLSDSHADTARIQVRYSTDGGKTWTAATGGPGGNGTSGLATARTGVEYLYTWASGVDLPGYGPPPSSGPPPANDVAIQIQAFDADAGSPASVSFVLDNTVAPAVPVAKVQPFATPISPGLAIPVVYTLAQAQSDPVAIAVQFSLDGGVTYATCTEVPFLPSEGTGSVAGLASTPGGTSHTFLWNALADLGSVAGQALTVRVTPLTPVAGTAGTASGTLTLSGNLPPLALVGTPATSRRTVTLSYALVDREGEASTVVVEYSDDAGRSWNQASELVGAPSEGLGPLGTAPGAGVPHTFVWNAQKDVPDLTNPFVRMRVTPTDPNATGQATTSGNFLVRNSAGDVWVKAAVVPTSFGYQPAFTVLADTAYVCTTDFMAPEWTGVLDLPSGRWSVGPDMTAVFGGNFDPYAFPLYPHRAKLYGINAEQGFGPVTPIFDPLAGIWSTGTPPPGPTLSGNTGDISPTTRLDAGAFIAGGYYNNGAGGGTILANVFRYDFDADSWTQLASMISPRLGAPVEAFEGKIYAFSGQTDSSHSPSGNGLTNACEVYDPKANSWRSIADTPHQLETAGSAAVDGTIYVISGNGYAALPQENLAYSPDRNVFFPKTAVPLGYEWGSLQQGNNTPSSRFTVVRDDRVLAVLNRTELTIVNGFTDGRLDMLQYSPRADFFSVSQAPLPVPLAAGGCDAIGTTVYVAGGTNGTDQATLYAYDSKNDSWASLAPLALGARSSLAAVALGGKLYAFGGTAGGTPLARAEAYDPGTNAWTTLPSLPGGARLDVAAVALGSSIYVVGGFDGTSALARVEAFAPATTSWASLASMPTARRDVALTVAGGLVYAIGGDGGGGPLATVEVFDPSKNVWTAGPSLQVPRTGARACTIAGLVYAIGGLGPFGYAETEVLKPAVGTWQLAASLPSDAQDVQLAVVGDQAFAIGGNSSAGIQAQNVLVAPHLADVWRPRASLPAAREHGAAAEADGNMILVGGLVGGAPSKSVLAYNAPTAAWVTSASAPTARAYQAAGSYEGKVYVAGGSNGGEVATLEVYTSATDSWATKAPMLLARSHAAAAVSLGLVYVAGGQASGLATTRVESYDPVTDLWAVVTSLNTARTDAAAASLHEKLYVVGGRDASGNVLSSGEVFDPRVGIWTALPPLPAPRAEATAAVDGGFVYVLGGRDATGAAVGSVYAYDPATNAWTTLTGDPSPRAGASAAVVRGLVLVAGGDSGGAVSTVEAYSR